ncbi:MAG: indole-3-glycerol phosphate synthase TrpC [Phycisphaerales bacterium]
MSTFLADMAASSRARLDAARAREPLAALESRARSAVPPRALALSTFDLIAEIKPASPSRGPLLGPHHAGPHATDVQGSASTSVPNTHTVCRTLAHHYAAAGAAITSVLTEPTRFGGSDELLRAISAAVATPTMRKDFLIDPYQVVQARADGASGILLITRMLSDSQLAEMLAAARAHNLFVLLEGFDETDLARVSDVSRLASGVSLLLGLNTRNLADLSVDPSRLDRLISHFPPGFPRVAESGLETPEDAGRIAALGYRLALVGTALMRSAQPQALARAMIARGRAVAAARLTP